MAVIDIVVAVLPVLADLIAVTLLVLAIPVSNVIARRQAVLQIVTPLAGRPIRKLTRPFGESRSVARPIAAQTVATAWSIPKPR
jgi:hypothetical protein